MTRTAVTRDGSEAATAMGRAMAVKPKPAAARPRLRSVAAIMAAVSRRQASSTPVASATRCASARFTGKQEVKASAMASGLCTNAPCSTKEPAVPAHTKKSARYSGWRSCRHIAADSATLISSRPT
jgi:hypothetical protein